MKRLKMVGDVPETILGMLADLALKLKSKSHTEDHLDDFLKKRNPFLQNGLEQCSTLYSALQYHSENPMLGGLTIPQGVGFKRLVWVHPYIRLTDVVRGFQSLVGMKCVFHLFPGFGPAEGGLWSANSVANYLDSERDFSLNYAFWVNDEVDFCFQDKSAKDIRQLTKSPITLEECLLHRLLMALEGQRLSDNIATVCAGSRVEKTWTPVVYSEYRTNEQEGWRQLCINFIHHEDAHRFEHVQTFLTQGRYLTGWEVKV
jgi:hypothetical protein